MGESRVHEHICEQLIDAEVLRHKEMQAQDIGKVNARSLKHFSGKKHYHVDDKQILCYWRYIAHKKTIFN